MEGKVVHVLMTTTTWRRTGGVEV